MAKRHIVTRDQWLRARLELLVKEKELTRARDRLGAERRRLPMVPIDKAYVFDGPAGSVELPDLFVAQRQLVIRHFMFDPRWSDGCPSCSFDADETYNSGWLNHLEEGETAFAAVSRAPYPKIADYQRRKGWNFPWYSSYGSDFNYDFAVTIDEDVTPVVYNYRTRVEHERAGSGYYLEGDQPLELPGYSCFLREDSTVFHTYSTYGRGVESIGGSQYALDLTALGRQHEFEAALDDQYEV